MKPSPLSEQEVDQLLRRELNAPQPSSAWRDRVLAATLRADVAAAEATRAHALDDIRERSRRRIAAERQRMLRNVSLYLLIAIASLAVLPVLLRQLAPAFGSVPRFGMDGISLTIGIAALCAGLANGFSRQLKGLMGL